MEIKELQPELEPYTCDQSQEIKMKTGLVGTFTFEGGQNIYTPYRQHLAGNDFENAFAKVIEALNTGEISGDSRINEDKFSFLLHSENGQIKGHCYIKSWLDQHIHAAEKGIRFIDTRYNDLFVLRDGGSIKMTYDDGTSEVQKCRFIDPYHMELKNIYHICEFAEKTKMYGITVEPMPGDAIQPEKKERYFVR